MTKQRQLIYDIVIGSHSHPTAEEVFFEAKKRMPSIVMATVYNNLNALTDMGLIRRVSVHLEPDRYDRIDIEHEHMKCDKCGAIKDIVLGDVFGELSKRCNTDITSYELNIHYICDECRNNLEV